MPIFLAHNILYQDIFLQLDVCWLRLDFETFQILGPSSTTEPAGATSCPDTFIVTVNNCSERRAFHRFGQA